MTDQVNNTQFGWGFLVRVIIKALILFTLCNGMYMLAYPAEWLGNVSLYGIVTTPRIRLPYGENIEQSYNVTVNNLPAMFASHQISHANPDDQFRILLVGDSSTWGWFLTPDQALMSHINSANVTIDNQPVVAYNLAYPVMSLTKDILILDQALNYQPDMVIWLVSLRSFAPEEQLLPPLVQHNRDRLLPLIEGYNLNIDPNSEKFITPSLLEQTIIGQRRPLADLLRLQTYGLAWTATGIDQFIPQTFDLRQSDFEADYSWSTFDEPTTLTTEDVMFDVLQAGVEMTGDVPIIIVNEPIFISDGRNSDIRYNSFYPIWAYDQYRALLSDQARNNGWQYRDLWDTIDPSEFTDTPVHLSADGTAQLADQLIGIIEAANAP